MNSFTIFIPAMISDNVKFDVFFFNEIQDAEIKERSSQVVERAKFSFNLIQKIIWSNSHSSSLYK